MTCPPKNALILGHTVVQCDEHGRDPGHLRLDLQGNGAHFSIPWFAAAIRSRLPVWKSRVSKYGLQDSPLDRLASWWHTDGDLGREVECVNSMAKSRLAGFNTYRDTWQSFEHLIGQLRSGRVVP